MDLFNDDAQADLDRDLYACSRGPATLDTALEDVPADQVLTRYKALLTRYGLRHAVRNTNRARWQQQARVETAAETAKARTGGNR